MTKKIKRKPLRCATCGKGGLHWKQNKCGDWRTHEKNGKEHTCHPGFFKVQGQDPYPAG